VVSDPKLWWVNMLSDENKEHIYVSLDALIRDFKNKQDYASK
jgi:hypothetical protein